jgi:hypothetical protein
MFITLKSASSEMFFLYIESHEMINFICGYIHHPGS